jgi:hypothetical protein
MSNGIETPRPLTPQEFARLQGQQSFIDYINETNNQLGMLQELQRVAGDGDLLDEDTGETPIGSLDPSLAEESVWNMLTSIMAGRQGTIQGLDPEIIEALETSVEGLNDDELRAVAAEIVAAGGFDEWLSQQPVGDPGGTEPQPDPEPEPEPEPPQQQGVSVEEFEQIFGEGFITEEMVEDGMYTDPETGIVYVINFPPDYQISEDAGGGGGGGEPEPEPSGGVQIGEDDQWVYQGNGIFRRDSDGAVIDVTDPDSSFYDDDFDPNNNPFIVGSIYGGPGRIGEPEPQPEPVEACPPGTVYNDLLGICEVDLTVPTKGDAPRQAPVEPEPVDPDDGDGDGDGNGDGAGDGDGNGAGDGDGDGNGDGDGTGTGAGAGGMLSPDGAFKPFMTSIGYTPVQLQQLIAPPKKDYFRELDGLIGRSLFGKMLK